MSPYPHTYDPGFTREFFDLMPIEPQTELEAPQFVMPNDFRDSLSVEARLQRIERFMAEHDRKQTSLLVDTETDPLFAKLVTE